MELNKRLEELENNACDIVIQNEPIPNKPILKCKGFLGKNALIKPYSDLKMGFYLDDDELYKGFINKKGDEDRNLGTDINLIQQTINDYFVGKDSGVQEVRENLAQRGQYIHSIKEYKSHGGVCAHRSAVANNLLAVLGYDCEMVWSNIGSENHAFIIIHDNDKHYIYDPANRSRLQDKSGHEWKTPTLVEKSEEEIKAFYAGQEDLAISEEDEKSKNTKQNNSDYYIKENGKWVDKSTDSEYIEQLYNNGIELEVVGIIKAKSGIKNTPKTGFVGYTNKLTEYVISEIKEKEITKEQLENKDIDVLTGEKFDNINSHYEDNLKLLGIADLENPSKISIYPKDFEAKKQLKQGIEDYNKTVEANDQIKYFDMTETLLSGVTTAVKMVSYVLIAFVAISLIVSGIMVSIITYISVLERTKEIGILRAIGASKKDVSRVFKAETIIEGLISGVLGIVVTFILNLLINVVVKFAFKIDNIASMPIIGAFILILISALLTVIAGNIPSKMASKKDPVESLRSE